MSAESPSSATPGTRTRRRRYLVGFAERLERTVAGRLWSRLLELEFVDRSVALAAKAFVSFFPRTGSDSFTFHVWSNPWLLQGSVPADEREPKLTGRVWTQFDSKPSGLVSPKYRS